MKASTRLLVISLALLMLSGLAVLPAAAQWTSSTWARISIVWPQDGAGHFTSVPQSRAVNISVWPNGQVSCTANPTLQLLVGRENDPVAPVGGSRQFITRTVSGVTFPSVEFNDIPANLAIDPRAKFRFVMYGPVTGGKQGFAGNVWVHAADPRTFYPNPVVPTGYVSGTAAALDVRIQIVWPHDYWGNFAPVDRATRVNVAVEIFEHGSMRAIPAGSSGTYPYSVALLEAIQNGWLHTAGGPSPVPVTYTVGLQSFVRWVFNDVPVTPGVQTHFVAVVTPSGSTDASPYASVWTHAVDARTYAPNQVVPGACIP